MSEFITADKARDLNLTEYNGRHGNISMDGLDVTVTVIDARVRFGHLDLLVAPVTGSGQKWIESRRVSLVPRPL